MTDHSHDQLQEGTERQWCAPNRRWFHPFGDMAGACETCRAQTSKELDGLAVIGGDHLTG